MDFGPNPLTEMLRCPIATIDFEASALSRTSYPIEVGICLWRASDQPIAGWSTLIRPTQRWIDEGDWNERSAEVHKIPKQALQTGISPAAAARALNAILPPGSTAWCNGGVADEYWCRTLAEAADVEPTFSIAGWEQVGAELDQLSYMRALRWLERAPPRHRARDDAERLMKAIARGVGLKHGTSTDLVVAHVQLSSGASEAPGSAYEASGLIERQ